MTTSSTVLRLQTLGRLRLSDDAGLAEVDALNRRPRKLALLVLLAISPRPRTRDQLIEMFWGDQTEERARHSLADALSHLRRVLGRDAITLRQSYVELGECALEVDAIELARAAAAGQAERVIALYNGPFLDGIFIEDADSFNRWIDAERRRLEQLFVTAAAARCAELLRDTRWEPAAALAARWLEVAPASGDAAVARLTALAAPGTRDAEVLAVEEYRRIRLHLSTSLGIAPDPIVTSFADRLSAHLASSSSTGPAASPSAEPMDQSRQPANGPPVVLEPEASPRQRRPSRYAALAGAVVLLVAFLSWRVMHGPPTAAGAPLAIVSGATLAPGTLAVLPLANLTGDTSDAYLASGLTEEISSRLTQLPSLHLRSAPAGERLQRMIENGPASLGRALGVREILQGSIRRVGGRARISVRLVDTETGFQRWGAEYELRAVNVLALQDSIAHRVAVAIGGELSSVEWSAVGASRTRDPVAYDHYLRGNYLLASRTPRTALRAIDELQSALRADPAFVVARLRIAYALAIFYEWGWRHPRLSRSALLDSGLAITNEAIHQHPELADSWLTHAYLLVQENPRTLAGTDAAFERAIAIDSMNAETYHQYGQTLMIQRRLDEAAAAYRHALRLDPDRSITVMPLAVVLDLQGQVSQSRQLLDSAVAMDPAAPYVYAVRGYFYARDRKWSAARHDAEIALGIDSSYAVPARSVLAAALAGVGDLAGARAEVARALRGAADTVTMSETSTHFLAFAEMTIGDTARALDLLERTQPRGAWLWFSMQLPEYDPVRHVPRFERLFAEASPKADHRRLSGASDVSSADR